jgi:hypothetical protein
MDLRHVTVYIRHSVANHKPPSRTVSVALDGLNVEGKAELTARGFVPEGDCAVIHIIGEDLNRMHQVLRDLEHWIVSWAEKQGAEPIFKWRVVSL